MQDAERQFAAENPVQTSPDSRTGIANSTKTDPMQTLITLRAPGRPPDFSRPLSTLVVSGVQVQKSTDIGHGTGYRFRLSDCETEKFPKKFSKKQKKTKQDPPSSRQYRRNPDRSHIDLITNLRVCFLGNGGRISMAAAEFVKRSGEKNKRKYIPVKIP